MAYNHIYSSGGPVGLRHRRALVYAAVKTMDGRLRHQQEDAESGHVLPYVMAVLAWLVSALVLNTHVYPLLGAEAGLVQLIRLTVGLWLAFAMLSTVLSTMFGLRGWALLWIDGGYTLLGGLIIALSYFFIVI